MYAHDQVQAQALGLYECECHGRLVHLPSTITPDCTITTRPYLSKPRGMYAVSVWVHVCVCAGLHASQCGYKRT